MGQEAIETTLVATRRLEPLLTRLPLTFAGC
jgi:hypothetical protein